MQLPYNLEFHLDYNDPGVASRPLNRVYGYVGWIFNALTPPSLSLSSSLFLVSSFTGEKPAAMQHPNKSPTAASGAGSSGASAAAVISRLTSPSPAGSCCLCWMATLLLTYWTYYWSSPWIRFPRVPSSKVTTTTMMSACPVAAVLRRTTTMTISNSRTTATFCILLVLVIVKTIFSKSIKLFDAV